MSLTNVARLGASVATFTITARVLGLERYGELMYWMSVASMLALASNFGLVLMLLREIGQRPDDAMQIFNESLSAKLIAVSAVIVVSCVGLFFIKGPHHGVFLFLLGAMVSEGFTEFFNAGFRARARFGVETRIAIITAWAYPISVGLVAWLTGSLLAISAAYFVSRVAISWLTWRQLCKLVGKVRPAGLAVGWKRVVDAKSYAFDSGLSGLFGQLDSVVLNHYMGPAAVGIHQAGMRLFLAGSGFASVLANVFLPRAAAAHAGPAGAFALENGKLQMTFLVVGAVFGVALAILGPWFAPLLFGKSFEAVIPLMPWFGLLFMVKFAGAAWSVTLTAQGRQWYRAQVSAVHWVGVFAIGAFAVPAMGNVGWLIALIAGNSLLFVLYAAKASCRTWGETRTLGLTTLLMFAFIPLIIWR